jgi:hypothetical protein
MPMREKMAQLMQGELEKWVDFKTGQFNISGMKDHMFYHSGMLRGKGSLIHLSTAHHILTSRHAVIVSHPLTTAEISFQGAHLLQNWIMNDTSLSLPAIVQSEGTYGSSRAVDHQPLC